MNVRPAANVLVPQAVPLRAPPASSYARALDPTAVLPRGEREQWAAANTAYGHDRDALRIAALRRNAALAAAARSEPTTTAHDDTMIARERREQEDRLERRW